MNKVSLRDILWGSPTREPPPLDAAGNPGPPLSGTPARPCHAGNPSSTPKPPVPLRNPHVTVSRGEPSGPSHPIDGAARSVHLCGCRSPHPSRLREPPRDHVTRGTPLRVPPSRLRARSGRGSDSPLDCHSLPRPRFATQQLSYFREER